MNSISSSTSFCLPIFIPNSVIYVFLLLFIPKNNVVGGFKSVINIPRTPRTTTLTYNNNIPISILFLKQKQQQQHCSSLMITKSYYTNLSLSSSSVDTSEKINSDKNNNNDSNDNDNDTPWNVRLNEFFRKPVPEPVREYLQPKKIDITGTSRRTFNDDTSNYSNKNMLEILKSTIVSSPGNPGIPRPLWVVIIASVPTALVWYGYYKFCIEEELMQYDIQNNKIPRGFGGYGTLGPFVYGIALGPIAYILDLPGGMNWSNVGIVFIYYTQFLLYDRVNELYRNKNLQEPLQLWWTLPLLFPFDLIVGLRQVHYLSQYWYMEQQEQQLQLQQQQTMTNANDNDTKPIMKIPTDPVVEFFPFIGSQRFTWQQFVTTPSLWCSLLKDTEPIDQSTLPSIIQSILSLGEENLKQQQQQATTATKE